MKPIDLGALAPPPPPHLVAERVAELRRRIAAGGRDPTSIRIVAVTKGFGLGAVDAALAAGVRDVGENRAEELLAKARARPGGGGTVAVRWHYLGAIQRRRVPALAGVVGIWETVARLEEGAAIAAHAPGATVLVQVNPLETPGHNGCRLEEAPALVDGL
ncbi:MAG TPA: alanine racemase, partial [Acidimicrobiales bacterium]|nr:alanine racemase [Acidimicrobiales bacterium]